MHNDSVFGQAIGERGGELVTSFEFFVLSRIGKALFLDSGLIENVERGENLFQFLRFVIGGVVSFEILLNIGADAQGFR